MAYQSEHKRTLRRAREALGVITEREGFGSSAYWKLRSCTKSVKHAPNPQPKLQNIDNEPNDQIVHDLTF